MLCVDVVPSSTFPKFRLGALKLTVFTGDTPVPLIASVVGDGPALLTIDTDPPALPFAAGLNSTPKLDVCPAAIVIGRLAPLVLNPVPLTFNWLTVSVADPVLRICTVWVLSAPTTTEPKLTLPGVNVTAACWHVPLTATTALVPCAVATVTVPVTFSAAPGAKLSVKVADCPAPIVAFVAIPLAVTSDAFTLTDETVTLAFPEFVIVTLLLALVPALTFPKFTLSGLAVIVAVAPSPDPLSATVLGEFGALLAMDTLPPALPADSGANCTTNVVLFPALTVAGVFSPDTLYPVPFTPICEIVRSALPEFVTVNICDFDCPAVTLPNAYVVGDTLSPACEPLPPSGTLNGEFSPSLVITRLPAREPPADGVNNTLNVSVCPGTSSTGVGIPLAE